ESKYGVFAAALGFVGDELRGVFLGRATNPTNHDDPLGRFVGQEHRQHVDELGALDRVTADSHGGRLTEPFAGRLIDRFIGERARARHNANLAGREDASWHDTDLAFAPAHYPGAVRPDQPGLPPPDPTLDPHPT